MSTFIESVYNENEPEVAADIERLLAVATDMHTKVTLSPGEENLFNSRVDPNNVVDLIEKYTEGVVYGWDTDSSIDDAISEVSKCLNMLKSNLC
jgi:hypothetical protein